MTNHPELRPLDPDDNPLGLFDKKTEERLGIADTNPLENPLSEETKKAFETGKRSLAKTTRSSILSALVSIFKPSVPHRV